MKFRILLVVLILMVTAATVIASGQIGMFGIVEKVVFEPNETSPERVQVWGAFAYADGISGQPQGFVLPKRGYLYFSLPDPAITKPEIARKEWADLMSVAGTGQAVAFGSYLYLGTFQFLDENFRNANSRGFGPPIILRNGPGGNATGDLRVHAESEPPSSPVVYSTNAGVIKISSEGNYAAMVKQLKQLLAK